ncbi:zinc-binding dehydrogenase [Streptomyces rimosus]|nr:zinc-binding dehydrogenase [Streptomyces rimosus]
MGVVRAGEVRAGDTVFVTSAAGAVGSLAGQLARLRAAAPDGVDVVIDQVGGDQLKAAVAVARSGARVALIGALFGQLGDTPTIGIDPVALITRGITLRGAPLFDHLDIVPEWTEVFGRGLRDGRSPFPVRC